MLCFCLYFANFLVSCFFSNKKSPLKNGQHHFRNQFFNLVDADFLFFVTCSNEKLRCSKGSNSRILNFIHELEVLAINNSNNDMHSLFLVSCARNNNIFEFVYKLTLPENEDRLNKIGALSKSYDDLYEKERKLLGEILDIKTEKGQVKSEETQLINDITK